MDGQRDGGTEGGTEGGRDRRMDGKTESMGPPKNSEGQLEREREFVELGIKD